MEIKCDVTDKDATDKGRQTFRYKSKTSELTQQTIEDAIEDYMRRKFNLSEVTFLSYDKAIHKPYEEVDLRKLPLYRYTRLADKVCTDDSIINSVPDECVIDALLAMLWTHYKSKTREQLTEELGSPHPSVEQIQKWVESESYSYRDYVSLYILDPLHNTMVCHIAKRSAKVMITCKVNNQHLYAITDAQLRTEIKHYRRLNLAQVEHRVGLTPDNYDFCEDKSTIGECTKPYILCNISDLSELGRDIQTEEQTMLRLIGFNASRVSMLEHPITDQIILSAHDYHSRKKVADRLFAQTGYCAFEFVNQTYCQLARSSCLVEVGTLPVETYGPEQLDILQQHAVHPFVCRTSYESTMQHRSIDMRRCYTSQLLQNNEPYPVFSYSDKKKRYDASKGLPIGEYCIDTVIALANGNMLVRRGWHPRVFVKYCLDKGYITNDNITHVMKASG
jgi:hypothetical protein